MNQHADRSRDHLEAVANVREHLRDLYSKSKAPRLHDQTRESLGAQIADAHQTIGHGLKVAGIHADLAQAEALERIANLLEARSPAPSAVTL